MGRKKGKHPAIKKIQAKKIVKRYKKQINYKNFEIKNIRRTGKQENGKYIFEATVVPQGAGIGGIFEAKNFQDYEKEIKTRINIKKGQKKEYKMKDFEIERDQRRTYGSGSNRIVLVNVKIKNKITGEIFEDWVKPIQLQTAKSINNIIKWR